MLRMDVAKLDRDVAHVARVCSKYFIGVYSCCKCFMWMLHMLRGLYTYVASVLFQMLQMLQMYVACVLSGCRICFTHMFGSISSECCIYFTHMLQVFYLDVAYVLQCLHTCFSGVSYVCRKCFI